MLTPTLLGEMLDLAYELGMTSLIEVHEAATLELLQQAIGFPNDKRSLLGINNRNLKLQKTDLSTTEELAAMAGEGSDSPLPARGHCSSAKLSCGPTISVRK